MKDNFETGWLANLSRTFTENFDLRPPNSDVNLIIIHCISLPPGHYGGNFISEFFTNRLDFKADSYFSNLKGIKVSPHIYIDRLGEATQFVSLNNRAWHAGESLWNGRRDCNNFSVGIELEGTDDTPFEDAQYNCLTDIIMKIKANKISGSKNLEIVGHSDVAPIRKTDPGPHFLWERVR